MKKLFVKTYGCQMNVRDSEEVTGLLVEQGYARTDSELTADVILFNTCSVREHAEHRVWSNVGALKALKAQRPELVIGVMGCMAKAQRGKIFQRMPHVDFISGPSQLYEVPELIEAVYKSRLGVNPDEADGGCNSVAAAGPIAAIQQKRRAEFKTIAYHSSPVQAMVTIMEGCDKVCSYCIIPYTRGPEVSRPSEQIVEEVRRVASEGYREVMLLGQNVNSYGRKRASAGLPADGLGVGSARTEVTFAGLLAEVNKVPGIERVRFITSHPWDAVEELFDAMRDLEHVCEHLHLPVQSGSDEVLKRMRRGYTGTEYLEKLVLLRSKVPDVAVTTDLIVGFPGETESDFEATTQLVEQARFDSAFIFSYSPRPYAAASRWEDDVPADVKDRRLQALLALQERISREEAQKQIGQTVQVLVEEPGMGRTRQNRKVYFPEEGAKAGDVVEIKAREVRGQSLIGSMVHASTSSARTVIS